MRLSAWISAFKVYLPRVREVAILEEAVPHEDLPAGAEMPLLVDDEPMVQDLAARVLRGQGYRVLEARNAPEALLESGAV